MKTFLMAGSIAVLMMSCGYYDSPSNRESKKSDQARKEEEFKDKLNCDKGPQTGCVTGQLQVSKVTLDGVEYFDAESLVKTRVAQLTLSDDKGVELVAQRDFEAALTQPLNNENFVEGFAVYVRGDEARVPAMVNGRGGFKVNYLDSGSYELRLQKKFDVTVVDKRQVVTEPATEEKSVKPEPAVVPVKEKKICVVIFADAKGVEILRGDAVFVELSAYRSHIFDKACAQTDAVTVVKL